MRHQAYSFRGVVLCAGRTVGPKFHRSLRDGGHYYLTAVVETDTFTVSWEGENHLVFFPLHRLTEAVAHMRASGVWRRRRPRDAVGGMAVRGSELGLHRSRGLAVRLLGHDARLAG